MDSYGLGTSKTRPSRKLKKDPTPFCGFLRVTPDLRKYNTIAPKTDAADIIQEKYRAKDRASYILLVTMLWFMRGLIIDVNVRSLDVRKIFQLNL